VVERIFRLMQDRGVSVDALSKEIGISGAAISQWERGEHKPDVDAIIKIAEYFGVTTDWLLRGRDVIASNTINTNNGNIGTAGQSFGKTYMSTYNIALTVDYNVNMNIPQEISELIEPLAKDKFGSIGFKMHTRQWFVCMWVHMAGRRGYVHFKVDTGCRALVLSHRTLDRLGYPTNQTDLFKLPSVPGIIASNEEHTFRKPGTVSLYKDDKQTAQICETEAICHPTWQTPDLPGTEVLDTFDSILFNTKGDRYMELKRAVAYG